MKLLGAETSALIVVEKKRRPKKKSHSPETLGEGMRNFLDEKRKGGAKEHSLRGELS